MSPRTSPHLLYLGDQVGPWTVIGFESREQANGSKEEVVVVSGADGEERLSFAELAKFA